MDDNRTTCSTCFQSVPVAARCGVCGAVLVMAPPRWTPAPPEATTTTPPAGPAYPYPPPAGTSILPAPPATGGLAGAGPGSPAPAPQGFAHFGLPPGAPPIDPQAFAGVPVSFGEPTQGVAAPPGYGGQAQPLQAMPPPPAPWPPQAPPVMTSQPTTPPGWTPQGPPSWTSGRGPWGASSRNAAFLEALRHGCVDSRDVKGRTSREAFWPIAVANIALIMIALPLVPIGPDGDPSARLGVLVLGLPLVTAAMRRMHDIGRPGYWVVVALLTSVVGLGVPLLILSYFLAQPGVPTDNQYGPPYRGPSKPGWW